MGRAIKVVSIVSPGDNGLVAEPDADELGRVTGSVNQFGQPYRSTIAGDGTGLTTGVLDAIRALVGDTRRDISLIGEDNPATAGVNESDFIDAIVAAVCPTTGINNCLGGQGTSTCLGCLADSQLSFDFRVGNDFVPQTAVDQVFDFDLVALADGSVELGRTPVRVMVPALGTSFGDGFYQNTYDSDIVCEMPPERPDWGTLTWTNLTTPSDSRGRVRVLHRGHGRGARQPDSVHVHRRRHDAEHGRRGRSADRSRETELHALPQDSGEGPSVDRRLQSTPSFDGWSMEFHCDSV